MREQSLPSWLKKSDSSELPIVKKKWSRVGYLDKTLRSIDSILAEEADTANINKYKGLLQALDPCIKFIGLMILAVSAGATHDMTYLLSLNIIVLAAAMLSGIRAVSFAARVWGTALFFAGIAVLPAVFSWVIPGDTLHRLSLDTEYGFSPDAFKVGVTITKQGVQAACLVILRCAASLGLMVLLLKTTRWSLLTGTLPKLGLPAAIVAVFDLSYRYLYLFLLLFIEYLLGRKSRVLGKEGQSAKVSWVGGAIAGFFQLTGQYGTEINQAMVSRGFYGGNYPKFSVDIRLIDCCFLAVVGLLCYYAWGGIGVVRIFRL